MLLWIYLKSSLDKWICCGKYIKYCYNYFKYNYKMNEMVYFLSVVEWVFVSWKVICDEV